MNQSWGASTPPPLGPAWDIRHVHDVVDTVNAVAGLVLVSLLTYLVVWHSPKEQTLPYKRILLIDCFRDCIGLTVPLLGTKLEMLPEGRVFLLLGRKWPLEWQEVFVLSLPVLACLFYLQVVPLQSLYRYCVICRGRKFTLLRLLRYFSVVAINIVAGIYLFLHANSLDLSEEARRENVRELASYPPWGTDTPSFFVIDYKVIATGNW